MFHLEQYLSEIGGFEEFLRRAGTKVKQIRRPETQNPRVDFVPHLGLSGKSIHLHTCLKKRRQIIQECPSCRMCNTSANEDS